MRNAINKLLDNRLVWILVSIVAAFLIWLWVVNSVNENQTRALTFEVQYEGLAVLENYNLRLAANQPDTVLLQVRASATDMIRLEQNRQIIVDVSGISEAGEYDVAFRPSAFSTMAGNVSFQFMQMGVSNAENTIVVRTNRITGRTISLSTANTHYVISEPGQTDYFYVGGQLRVYPEDIQIDGPEEILEQIASIEVEVEFPTPLTATTTKPGALRAYSYTGERISDASLAELVFSQDSVSVTVPVHMVRNVPLVPIFIPGAGASEDNLSYRQSQETVWLMGEGDVLRDLAYLELPQVRLDQVPTIYSVRLDIPTPALTEIYDGPGYVDIELQVQEVSERTMNVPAGRVVFTNVPENMTPSVVIDMLALVIRGPEEMLAELDESDISVLVSLADYEGRTGRLIVEEFSVLVGEWPPETIGAMDLPGQGIIVNVQWE